MDLEVSPTLATVWGLFNQNIGINQLLGNSQVLCWAAQWVGDDEVFFASDKQDGHKRMIKKMHRLLSEADAVVTYNGDSFDLKILSKEFLMAGLPPPTPYKSIDLYKTVKRRFRFTSNKLDYVAQQLGIGSKTKHPGHELWLNVMNKSSSEYESSWHLMETYNIQDVLLTGKLYEVLKGWVPNHPSFAVFNDEHCCPNCASKDLQRRGFQLTRSLRYQRYQCNDCGSWSRGKTALPNNRAEHLVSI